MGSACLPLRARDRAHLDLQLVAETLDPALHAYELAALEAAGEHVGFAEGAPADRAGAVAQLDVEVGGAAREIWRSLRVHAKTESTSSSARSVATVCSGHGSAAIEGGIGP